MSLDLLFFRLVHVLGGIFWLGAGVFSAVYLMPSLAAARVKNGPLFAELERRGYFVVLPVMAVLTMLSGVRLLAVTSGGFRAEYLGSAQGLAYAIGGVASVLAFLVAMFVGRPSNQRAGQLQGTLATLPSEHQAVARTEIAALRRRGTVATAVAILALVVSAGLMAIARYV